PPALLLLLLLITLLVSQAVHDGYRVLRVLPRFIDRDGVNRLTGRANHERSDHPTVGDESIAAVLDSNPVHGD
ncbi:unnamed protein product, partial [Mycena citricolor]